MKIIVRIKRAIFSKKRPNYILAVTALCKYIVIHTFVLLLKTLRLFLFTDIRASILAALEVIISTAGTFLFLQTAVKHAIRKFLMPTPLSSQGRRRIGAGLLSLLSADFCQDILRL